jgi:four helix bundle protein
MDERRNQNPNEEEARRPMSERIDRFEQLRVYQRACELDLAVFEESKRWPPEEKYALTDQVRRSSRAIGANIAEAWAKRRYPAHFVSKLTDADGELNETRHWLYRAEADGYLPESRMTVLLRVCDEVGGMLGKMIANPESFCGH